jgi:hypothetical protein
MLHAYFSYIKISVTEHQNVSHRASKFQSPSIKISVTEHRNFSHRATSCVIAPKTILFSENALRTINIHRVSHEPLVTAQADAVAMHPAVYKFNAP